MVECESNKEAQRFKRLIKTVGSLQVVVYRCQNFLRIWVF